MGHETKPTDGLPAAILKELLSFDTATLYEGGGAEVVSTMSPGIRPIASGQRIAGPALTVACPGGDNLMLHAAVADAAPGEVLVVQCHDASYGVWGEVLMTGAMAGGIVGLVIDGGVRDLEAMREAGFPVFSRAVAIRGASKSRRGLARQPISCGGILVWPGDIVVADDSGVIAIAAHQVEAVVERAGTRRDKEARMLESLRAGQTTADLLGLRGVLARETA